MDHQPQPPAGSTINVITDGDATHVSWRRRRWHPLKMLCLGFGLMIAASTLIIVLVSLLTTADGGGPNHLQAPREMFWLMAVFQLPMAGFLIYGGWRVGHPESIAQEPDRLTYDTGSPLLPWYLAWFFLPFGSQMGLSRESLVGGEIRWRRKVHSISHREFGPVTLDRVGERQRLTIDHGADRIEVGASLREPEREWLADVLTTWTESQS